MHNYKFLIFPNTKELKLNCLLLSLNVSIKSKMSRNLIVDISILPLNAELQILPMKRTVI